MLNRRQSALLPRVVQRPRFSLRDARLKIACANIPSRSRYGSPRFRLEPSPRLPAAYGRLRALLLAALMRVANNGSGRLAARGNERNASAVASTRLRLICRLRRFRRFSRCDPARLRDFLRRPLLAATPVSYGTIPARPAPIPVLRTA